MSPKQNSYESWIFFQDYQADSGIVLPSEELKHFTLHSAKRSKESLLSSTTKRDFYSFSCGHISDVTQPFIHDNIMWEGKHGFPRPIYNSVVRYSTPPV
ncbi:hypothetical protein JD844_033171 [Phrynosoma platyrhinos]|uniref:Uncharacterized protein n=1 Tax=Phrynosoma platyrhinos TaxID=52577 RepID=A0ABQ7T6J6_PHRPL|nr:hypothetical protein JD844_033171 [Phrynosoma platyrhinos]